MTDNISQNKRSWVMSRVTSKNTSPEKIVRSLLHGMGYRFRLHRKDLPGCPDIVLPKYGCVIFVHGCFWHRHKGCKKTRTPKSNVNFSENKFRKNILGDKRHKEKLESQGWKVLVVWECEVDDTKKLCQKMKSFLLGASVEQNLDDVEIAAEEAGEYK